MHSYLIKLRSIFLPFLICLILLLAGYTFLNWLFVIKLEWINLDDFIIQFLAPMGLAFLLAVTVLRPAIRRLYFNTDKKSDFVYFIATLGMAVPTVIAQFYISTATGTLTRLHDISQIDALPKTKYYSLEQYYFYKNAVSYKEDITTSGKNNQYMDFTLYCVVPILRSPKDSVAGATHYWLCTQYTDQVSNYASDGEKQAAFERFLKESEKKFSRERFPFSYLERISHGKDAKYFGYAVSRNSRRPDDDNILLKAQKSNFDDRNGGKLGWIFKSAGFALLAFALLLLCYRLKTPSELGKVNAKVARDKARGWKKNYAWILPHEGFFVIPILLYVNVLMYVVMVFSGLGFDSFNGAELLGWGSLHKGSVLHQGEWWRLVSYMFIHGGLMHIMNNMISLYFVGFLLESLIGKWRFVIVYLITGVCAGVASLIFHDQINTVGASGAIFGVYGFLLALFFMKVSSPQLNKIFFTIASVSMGISLIMGFLGNVDNVAHISGLVSGFLMGLLLSGGLKGDVDQSESE